MTELERVTPAAPVVIGGADLEVSELTERYEREAVRDNTRRAREYAIREFTGWCDTHGRVALPATRETLAEYVTNLRQLDRAPATIEQAIGLIRGWHARNGHEDQPPTKRALENLRGYKRKLAEDGHAVQRQAPPLGKAEMHVCLGALDLDTLRGRRDQIVLVFGYMMMARRSELAALRLADVLDTANGLVVTVRTSKTDRESAGRTVALPPQSHPDGDPVRVFRDWRATLAERGVHDGPLFWGINRGGNLGRPLAPGGVNDIVRSAARAAGLEDAERYTAHSLRSGGLTDSLERGTPPGVAARHGGWDPESPMLGRYARAADQWRNNAMRNAL